MKHTGVVLGVVTIALMAAFCVGAVFGVIMSHPAQDEWQAALDINNWTNRSLEIDIYVMSNDTDQLSTSLDNECNTTLVVTWYGEPEVLVVLHCVGEGVDAWLGYVVEPGEWQSIILW